MQLPIVIQGGMGVSVSGWPLARAVSTAGQLGVVAGTALATGVARRLQLGDEGGHLRRAFAAFPLPKIAERIWQQYWSPPGKPTREPFKLTALPSIAPSRGFQELTVLANFTEVFLAKEGHGGIVGINLLEKIQFPTLASLFGAMLAGVDYVLMGAGIPRAIPGALDRFAMGEPAELKIDVQGALPGEEFVSRLEPAGFFEGGAPQLKRPGFLGVVSSAALATTLARKSSGRVDGFIIEGPTAGGHNAPPRGPLQLTPLGEPVYGPRDVPEIDKIRDIGLPFWLAGSYGRPGKLKEALGLGATGIQVGTPFAFCEESGILPEIRREALRLSQTGEIRVVTDPSASPTGFPFKVLQLPGTRFDGPAARPRIRTCDLGYLRRAYRRDDGTVGYRCPAEPEEDFLRKGGSLEETLGRTCVCNGLFATIGLGQIQPGGEVEPVLITAGNDVTKISEFLKPGRSSYSAADVLERLVDGLVLEPPMHGQPA